MNRSTWWMIAGVVSILGGVFALLNPMAASVTAVILAGWAFLLIGFLQLAAAFSASGAGNKIILTLLGLLAAFLGWTLLANPLAGMVTLTLAVAALILVQGIVRLVLAFDFKGTSGFWPLILSAGISGLLGLMIMADFPQSATTILGIFLGVDLIFNGLGLLGMSRLAKQADPVA